MADRACEQMSSRSKNLPSSEWWSGRQRQRPSLRGGAPAEGECGRIFPRRVEVWKRGFRRPSRRRPMTQMEVLAPMRECSRRLQGGCEPGEAHRPRVVGVVQPAGGRALPVPHRSLELGQEPIRTQPYAHRRKCGIRVEASRDNAERLTLMLPDAEAPIAPTHWSFGQLPAWSARQPTICASSRPRSPASISSTG